MRKGQTHSEATRQKISEKTKSAMQDPKVKKKILKTAFKKGNPAWNKGKKGLHLSPSSEFKKGEKVGKTHPSWKGGVHKMKHDCVHLWDGANKRKRRPVAVYEEKYGKIPKGFVIYHKDGDKDNDSPENLEAISRAELLRRNLRRKQ